MSSNEEFFGLDNPGVKTSNFPKWDIQKGREYRFAIGVENIKAAFAGKKTHFYNKKRFTCKSTDKARAVCCTHEYGENGKPANEPKWRFGTVVVVYEINSATKQITSIQALPWYFNDQVWHQLRAIQEEFPLDTVDLKLVAVDPQMMKFTITNFKECLWRKHEKLKAQVLSEYPALLESLPRRIASNLSIPDLMEHLGLGDGSVAGDTASNADLSAIVEDL